MSYEKICLLCESAFYGDEHGNRQYCSDFCYHEQKRIRSNENYWQQKEHRKQFDELDAKLKLLHEAFGSDSIEARILNTKDMNWELSRGTIQVEGLPAKQIGEFAYTLFTDETIRIWKL